MAQVTGIYVKHNLDVSSPDNLRKDLEKRLNIRINLDYYYCELEELRDIKEEQEEFTLQIFEHPDDHIYYLEDHVGKKSMKMGAGAVDICDYCENSFSEWWSVPYWLDGISDKEEYDNGRKEIYKVAQLLGADECIMLNDEWLTEIASEIEDGIPLDEAIKDFEEKYPTKKVKREHHNYNKPEEQDIEVPRKIEIISPHENPDGKKYYGAENWYDTIVIDDFRDFK